VHGKDHDGAEEQKKHIASVRKGLNRTFHHQRPPRLGRGAIADEETISIVVPRKKLYEIRPLTAESNQLIPHLRKNAPLPIKKKADSGSGAARCAPTVTA
jgi:hypothetical protein